MIKLYNSAPHLIERTVLDYWIRRFIYILMNIILIPVLAFWYIFTIIWLNLSFNGRIIIRLTLCKSDYTHVVLEVLLESVFRAFRILSFCLLKYCAIVIMLSFENFLYFLYAYRVSSYFDSLYWSLNCMS